MNFAQLSEAIALTDRNSRRNLFEIAIVRKQYAIRILRDLCHNGVRGVGWQNVAQASNGMAFGL